MNSDVHPPTASMATAMAYLRIISALRETLDNTGAYLISLASAITRRGG